MMSCSYLVFTCTFVHVCASIVKIERFSQSKGSIGAN